MNNEPVAWINVEKRRLEWDKPTLWETPTVVKLDRIPLYTHPAKTLTAQEVMEQTHRNISEAHWKAKTLTDEEIYEVWKKAMQEEAKIEYSIYATQLERQPFLYFAKAILRKAQEK